MHCIVVHTRKMRSNLIFFIVVTVLKKGLTLSGRGAEVSFLMAGTQLTLT